MMVVVAGVPGHAQDETPPVAAAAAKTMTGAWEFSNARRDKTCTMTFQSDAAPGGRKLETGPACAANFPSLKSVTGWSLGADDLLKFFDNKGTLILEFFEVEGGLFEGERRGEGIFFLQNQAAAGGSERTAEQVFGGWSFSRNANDLICALTLGNTPAGQGRYRLQVEPGCDAAIAAFAPQAWRMDRGELVISGRGGEWRFEEDNATTWIRIPASAGPLQLMKK
jgi:hypothetical protein